MNQIVKSSDSGLFLRGMLLFAVVAVIAIVVLVILLNRPGLQTSDEPVSCEMLAFSVSTPQASFPGNVNWGAAFLFSDNLPSPKGWETRYNATLALARRGSEHVPFDVLSEMLDERRQMVNYRVRAQHGKFVNDEAGARRVVFNALKAIGKWHKHDDTVKKIGTRDAGLKKTYHAIKKLLGSENNVIRTEARNFLSLQKAID